MLTLSIDDLQFELEDGAVKHVGAKTTGATAKLYHVETADARAFGDRQVKLGFDDDEGNEVEIALDTDAATALADGIAASVDETATDMDQLGERSGQTADSQNEGGERPF